VPAPKGNGGRRGASRRLLDAAAAEKLYQANDQRDDQQDVDQAASDVEAEPEQPQNQQNDRDCPQHGRFLFLLFISELNDNPRSPVPSGSNILQHSGEQVIVRRLGPADVGAMRRLNALFHAAFDGAADYVDAPPDDGYLAAQLAKEHVVALVAEQDGSVVGGLVAYLLDKLEQARGEAYIYDLAIAESHRRRGVATSLIKALRPIARAAGAHVMFVQADYGDDPAIALYTKLGTREDVMHFDIAVQDRPPAQDD